MKLKESLHKLWGLWKIWADVDGVEDTLPDSQPLYEEKTAREVVNHIERQGVKVIDLR